MNNLGRKERKYTASDKIDKSMNYFCEECLKKAPCEHQLNRINYILRTIDKKDPHMLRLMQAGFKGEIESKNGERGSITITVMICLLSISMTIVLENKGLFTRNWILLLLACGSMVIMLLDKTVRIINRTRTQEEAVVALYWIDLYLKYGYVPDRDYDIEEEQEIRKYRKGDLAEKMHPYQEPEEEQE